MKREIEELGLPGLSLVTHHLDRSSTSTTSKKTDLFNLNALEALSPEVDVRNDYESA